MRRPRRWDANRLQVITRLVGDIVWRAHAAVLPQQSPHRRRRAVGVGLGLLAVHYRTHSGVGAFLCLVRVETETREERLAVLLGHRFRDWLQRSHTD